jgi:hypothetical protein
LVLSHAQATERADRTDSKTRSTPQYGKKFIDRLAFLEVPTASACLPKVTIESMLPQVLNVLTEGIHRVRNHDVVGKESSPTYVRNHDPIENKEENTGEDILDILVSFGDSGISVGIGFGQAERCPKEIS